MKRAETKRCEKCGKLYPLSNFALRFNSKKTDSPSERRFDTCKHCYKSSKEFREKLSKSPKARKKNDRKKREFLTVLKKNAAVLRSRSTKAEKKMYQELKDNGLVFIPQYPVADSTHGYIVDAFIPTRHGNAGIILEIDGEYHLSDEQIELDGNRDDYFHMRGFVVIRVTNDQVMERVDDIIELVKTYDPKRLSDVSLMKRSKNGKKTVRLS